MYRTQTNVIRGLNKQQYLMLVEMCRYANNLYNVALYNIRQYYFKNKKFLTYENNYHTCKTNENYNLLQAGISQQTLKIADRSFKSFFKLINKAKNNEYSFQDIKMPHYRKKGGMFNLILSTNAITIKNGYLKIPISRAFKKLYPDCDIRIPFPQRLENKIIKEIRILPIQNGKCFKIQYIYITEPIKVSLDTNNAMAIDLGVNNLASCVTTLGTSFIMDGRKLKSINQGWNKEKARLQSISHKQGNKHTIKLSRITENRNNQVKDIMRKTVRFIVNYCLDNNIGTIIVGYNPDFKRNVNLGKRNNQMFAYISFGDFRQLLSGLCEYYNINYVEQEESYTSKSSFIDNDVLPEYQADCPYVGKFSGVRIHRGLYKTLNGIIINADMNGAANILRKSKQNFDFEELCSGLLATPQRIRLS